MSAAIRNARAEVYRARRKLRAAVDRRFPVNSLITYSRSGGTHRGQVLMHGSGDEGLKVRNLQTRKEYWIAAYDIEGCGS